MVIEEECNFCGEEFESKHLLEEHLASEHKEHAIQTPNITDEKVNKVNKVNKEESDQCYPCGLLLSGTNSLGTHIEICKTCKNIILNFKNIEVRSEANTDTNVGDDNAKPKENIGNESHLINQTEAQNKGFDRKKKLLVKTKTQNSPRNFPATPEMTKEEMHILADKIVSKFENSIQAEDEESKRKALELLKNTNPNMMKGKLEPFSLQEIKDLLHKTKISQRQMLVLVKKLRQKWGQSIVEPWLLSKLREEKSQDHRGMPDTRLSSTHPHQHRKKTGKEVKCEICGRELSCNFTLRRHMKSCINYPSTREEKTGSDIAQIMERNNINVDPNTYKCDQCGKKLSRYDKLTEHVAKVHPT